MIFSKTKKAEKQHRNLRFIEGTLRSFARDIINQDTYYGDRGFNEMIEDRAKEILEWI